MIVNSPANFGWFLSVPRLTADEYRSLDLSVRADFAAFKTHLPFAYSALEMLDSFFGTLNLVPQSLDQGGVLGRSTFPFILDKS